MNIPKRIFFSTASLLNMNWLKKQSPLDLLISCQHLVCNEYLPHISPLYHYKNTRQFEKDLEFLLQHFEPVSLEDVILSRKTGTPFPKKSMLLSFDDGLTQAAEIAAPILLRKGIPACFFLNPPFIDNKELFYDLKKGLLLHRISSDRLSSTQIKAAAAVMGENTSSSTQLMQQVRNINWCNRQLADELALLLHVNFGQFLATEKPFMTTTQVRQLINQGFHIGAHSMDHPKYSLIGISEQLSQTLDSLDQVCSLFQLPYRAFAFPYLDLGVSQQFFDLLYQSPGAPDLVLGNQTGKTEAGNRVIHRFIAERPSLSLSIMTRGLLSYSIAERMMKTQEVLRKP